MNSYDETKSTGSESSAENAARKAVREGFAALPLDQRLIALVEVELDLLGDAAQTVINSVSKAADEFAEAFKSTESSQSESAPSS